ncbi:DsbA family protein [Marinilabilia rubra]|nr:thioredoxin domain-containing protein [Marinilabilia rubra]
MNRILQATSLVVSAIIFVLIIIKLVNYYSDKNNSERPLEKPLTESENDIVWGSPDASLTMYMFSSYKCKFCSLFFTEVFPEINEKYIDTGTLKVVLKPVNLREDENMMKAIQASVCVNKFGKFEKFHELLITNPNVVKTEDFQVLLDDFIAANPDIAQCLLENNDYEYIRKNNKEFSANNFSGTPTFVIEGKIYSGFRNFEQFEDIFQNETSDATY